MVYYNFSRLPAYIHVGTQFGDNYNYYDRDGNPAEPYLNVPPYGNVFVLRSDN
ncbi:MAG: hypothetical protein HC896_05475 [Bacteroidales bacterium]|nr:hypothetical protein [Bacteroidales bacterium]